MKKTDPISFRIPEEINLMVCRRCKVEGKSRSHFFLEAIVNKLGYKYIPAHLEKLKQTQKKRKPREVSFKHKGKKVTFKARR